MQHILKVLNSFKHTHIHTHTRTCENTHMQRIQSFAEHRDTMISLFSAEWNWKELDACHKHSEWWPRYGKAKN